MYLRIAFLAFILFVLLASVANAAVVGVFSSKGDRIILTDEPCKAQAIARVKPEYHAKFKHATYYVGQTKQTVIGCHWLYERKYILIWDDGDVFEMPEQMFSGSKV